MSRSLRDLPDGVTLLVDANVVVYALSPQSRAHGASKDLLDRCAAGAVSLSMTTGTVADVIHRTMVLEVLGQGLAQTSGEAVSYLKKHPGTVRQLARYRTVLRDLTQLGVNILPMTYRDLHASREYRERFGLLTNDSLLLAIMRRECIADLATNDADFDQIPDITVWMPMPTR